MDGWTAALLVGAGLVGGVMSAIAGGASLITFPAMLAAGLPPIVANASNSVGGIPGSLVAAVADRNKLPALDQQMIAALAATVVGGALGCALLLVTPERVFTALIPLLVGFATCLFAFGPRARDAVTAVLGQNTAARPWVLFTASIYGGYFGAGLGVIFLALLSVTGREDIRAANALKNVLSTVVSLIALTIFLRHALINWPATMAMFAGSVAGGLIGGRLVAVLPATAIRAAGIAAGLSMTIVYAWRYWL